MRRFNHAFPPRATGHFVTTAEHDARSDGGATAPLLLTVAGFILALRAVRRQDPSLDYWGGVRAGAVAALVSAVVAVVAQAGYFTVIHPAWPEVMAVQTREHFTAQGLPAAEAEQMVLQARDSFTLSRYAFSSAATALILGIVLSAILMVFLRRRPTGAPDAKNVVEQ